VAPCGANDKGSMGGCAPRTFSGAITQPAGVLFCDRSNNNTLQSGAALKAEGCHGLIAKANQGSWDDPTTASWINNARSVGLAVGVYDFDADYTVAEAKVFASAARAVAITPTARNTFLLILDVEWGSFNYTGLKAQIHYLVGLGYRVGIYTGEWYWTPHAGDIWPTNTYGWLSGYPVAVTITGMPTNLYVMHQYTSSPLDQSVYFGSLAQFEAFVNNAPVPVKTTTATTATKTSTTPTKRRNPKVKPKPTMRLAIVVGRYPHKSEVRVRAGYDRRGLGDGWWEYVPNRSAAKGATLVGRYGRKSQVPVRRGSTRRGLGDGWWEYVKTKETTK
jgi:hypothetical protein